MVEAEGIPSVREMTYVLIHDVPDGGWGIQGKVYLQDQFKDKRPPDPEG